jgi:hypothetical protein
MHSSVIETAMQPTVSNIFANSMLHSISASRAQGKVFNDKKPAVENLVSESLKGFYRYFRSAIANMI